MQEKDEVISDLVRRAESLEHSLLQKQGSFRNLEKAKSESELKASENVKLAQSKAKREVDAANARIENVKASHAKVVSTLKDQIASLEAANKAAVSTAASSGSNNAAEITSLKAQMASIKQSEASARDSEAALQNSR